MRVYPTIDELRDAQGDVHLALGVFDGVHVGHQAVIAQATKAAKLSRQASVGVLTFDPHPIRVLAPARAPRRILASIGHKAELVNQLGVDFLCVQEFTVNFAQQEAEVFIRSIVDACQGRLASISVGEDWVFGKGRGGNVGKLLEWGEMYQFDVHAAAPVRVDGERVSSTRIRQAIRDGSLEAVEQMLGRQFAVRGTVERGRQLARQLGYPTANVVAHNEQLPPDGVWQLEVKIGDTQYHAIGNLGRRPTVETEDARRLLEVHVFGFEGDLYDAVVEATFMRYIRAERKFDSVELLKAQIEADVADVKMGLGIE
ncbi:riboflavin biosynthesis protein RibF [Rubritalea marina]|uniref:riboflavin biosynthesis protein RibF n=1 Tax=Rubritalea marina TaxID=361055 RepID=UPI000382BA5C|nr:riboflavin biosynthesis protein RibF [Rubritalea marina]